MTDFNIEINEVVNLPPEWFKKVKAWLAGNKTILGEGVLLFLTNCGGFIPEPYRTGITVLISILTGLSLKEHVKKGFFTTKKGS